MEKRLSKHKMTIFSKNLGGHGPFGHLWLRLWRKIVCQRTYVALACHTMHHGSISGISSDKKLIHLSLCCSTTMQIYCGLTDCIGSRTETSFSLCRFLKSCANHKFSIFIAFLFSLQLFLSRLASDIKIELVTKTNQFCTVQPQVENCASEGDRVCLILVRLGEKFSRGREIYEQITLLILADKWLGRSPACKS